MHRFVVAFAAAAVAGAAIPAGTAAATTIAAAVADPARPAAEVATDGARQPAATLAFAGVAPGMQVGEFFPGGGYFTRLLGAVAGADGHVYAIENAGWKSSAAADQAMVAKAGLTNVSIAVLPFGTVAFPVPLDLVWVTQNYHDLKIAKYGTVDTAAFDAAVFAALKPGGTFLVVDHEAPPGTGTAQIATLHRIEKAQVIREITGAGFVLAAEGDFLRHPSDDHTLPIFDEKVRGHTDQYALKFVKPR